MINVEELHAQINRANNGLKFVLPDEVAGWCPIALGSLLGNLLNDGGKRYLELGTFCGKSLIYALRTNKNTKAYVIDPLPDSMVVGQSTVWQEWNKNIDAYGIRDQVTLFRYKIEDLSVYIPDIDIALIDGNHDSGHTYEALIKCEQWLADEALIIIDDYNIYGGNQQTPFLGHNVDVKCPVRTDTHRYLAERADRVSVLAYTPWLNSQLYLHFKRQ
jgi:hypothetical protein